MKNLRRWQGWAVLLAGALISSVWAENAAERAAKAGELITLKEHRVLRLFALEVKERGFAHGYLLAEDIRDDAEAALQSLPMFGPDKFDKKLVPWARKFTWDADAIAELDGIFEGMRAKLGAEGLQAKVLHRQLTRDDLTALNVLADYFGPACSAFSAWGKRTADGGVIQARTLDFPIGAKAIKDQVIVVWEAIQGNAPKRAWIAVGWPGLIVQYSGINADGLVACIHDGYNVRKGRASNDGFVARGLLLRRMLEQIDLRAGDPAEKAAEMAATAPTACGNLMHLTWPTAVAEKNKTTPDAVIEFDPADRKIDIRRMDNSGVLVLTNHFRQREAPIACERFTKMTDGLALLEQAQRPVGVNEARKVLMAAEQAVAAHSIYFFPDKLELHIALTRDNVMSPRVPPTAFTLKELFRDR